jgi:4-amino-4-deoxy-L-arabinose transferase-like glycosyltransferase
VLARVLSAIAPGSLTVLRLPSALAAGTIVVLAGLSARELGASRPAQTLATASMATGAVLLGSGHLLSTATFNFLAWSLQLWLVLRLLRTGGQRQWLVVGVVAGAGLLNNNLVAFLLGGLVVGVVVGGPRHVLRSQWLWLGSAVAVLMWSPYLWWQARHGWPQLAVSRSIAAGNSGTSQPRALLLPMQLVLLSPYLAPIWITGLVRLLRDPSLRWCRALGVAYPVLAVVFVISGGKSYYLAGMFPLLLAAGAQPAVDWIRRGRTRWRTIAMGGGLGLSGLGAVLATLPVVPVTALHDTPIVSFNYDTGETVGWPAFVDQIADVHQTLSAADRAVTVIVASNYGEAGAVDRYGAARGLPHAYSVDNGYWYWGPPLDTATKAIAIGFSADELSRFCADSTLKTRLDNRRRIENDEQDAPVWFCSRLRGPWSTLWPHMREIG